MTETERQIGRSPPPDSSVEQRQARGAVEASPRSMKAYQFTEKAANRWSITSGVAFMATAGWGLVNPKVLGFAAIPALTAGLFTGRVVEARERRAGRGLIPPADQG